MRIDAFNHFFPKKYFEMLLASGIPDIGKRVSEVPALHDLDLRLKIVDSFPDYAQVLSLPMPSLEALSKGDPKRALEEIHRLLKPNGQLLFVEHVRADDPRLARWQDRLHGFQVRFAHGCHCNRRTLESIEDAGFQVAELTHDRLRKAPPIVRPLIVGAANRP